MITRSEYDQERQQIISMRRSRRMRQEPGPLPELPPKLPPCFVYQIFDLLGNYIGTVQTLAEAAGYTTKRVKDNYASAKPLPTEFLKYMTTASKT